MPRNLKIDVVVYKILNYRIYYFIVVIFVNDIS